MRNKITSKKGEGTTGKNIEKILNIQSCWHGNRHIDECNGQSREPRTKPRHIWSINLQLGSQEDTMASHPHHHLVMPDS